MKAIRLQRFKGYRDSGWIDLRPPIILLLGANSSGKSALLNALLMLKQSLEDASYKNPFVFYAKKGVDIGSFEDAVFRHEVDIKKPMAFSFDVEVEKDFSEFNLSKGDSVILSIKVAYNQKRRTNVIIGFDMVRDSDKKCILSMRKRSTSTTAKASFKSDLFEVPDDLFLTWSNFLPATSQKKSNTFPLTFPITFEKHDGGENKLLHELHELNRDIVLQIINHLQYIVHIGPLRPEPERTYQFTGETPSDVGRDGHDALKILFLDKYSASSKNLIDDVNRWLETMGYVLEWDILKGEMAQLMLKDKSGMQINLKDAGFGISQLLPVLIQGYLAEEEQIILMEQPEIHLHPRAQADLGDMFIALAEQKKSLIVETHSEHLMLRLRRRIAEQKIPKEMVGIYFIEWKDGESVVSRIELDDYGQMVNVPEGFKTFFSDDFEETMKITKEIAKRHAKEIECENSA
ncbi:MAG: AAA family ATPase [Euryarchaeota archaeon]|nr:AAA family ATPase [Euryarchaeota archaeon]